MFVFVYCVEWWEDGLYVVLKYILGLCGENGILPIKETMEALADIQVHYLFLPPILFSLPSLIPLPPLCSTILFNNIFLNYVCLLFFESSQMQKRRSQECPQCSGTNKPTRLFFLCATLAWLLRSST